MSHATDPAGLASDADYVAALDELEALLLADADTPAGRRFDDLVGLIEDYEARHWPAEVARVPEVRAPEFMYGPLSPSDRSRSVSSQVHVERTWHVDPGGHVCFRHRSAGALSSGAPGVLVQLHEAAAR